MTGAVLEPPPKPAPPMADAALLEDRVPDEWKFSRRTAVCTLAFGLLYLVFAIKPLWHTDVWGHLAYGRWMWSEGRLPTTEPLMPLAVGVPFIDTAWLSQLLGYSVMQSLGPAGLQGLVGLAVTVCALLVFHRVMQRTQSVWFAALAVVGFLWLDWGNLAVARPQFAGLLCFLILLHRLTSRSPAFWDWLLLPLLFCAWANLHGSFVIGLGLLAAHVAGRAIDLIRRTKMLRSLAHDQTLRRWLVWLELGVVATLLNPYGLGLWLEVARFADNPNLRALTEWQPLNVRAPHGFAFLTSAIALVIAYRCTPRRVAAWEALMLFGLGLSTLWSARFLVWWGPVAAILFALHAHAALLRWAATPVEAAPSPRSGKWTVVTFGLVWIFFAYSPLGLRLLHKTEPKLAAAVSSETPLSAVKWLNEHPPVGQVFNTYEWGDYLQWAGPAKLQVFVNSHAHLLPREVWQHYLSVVEVSAEWEDVLNRYGVNTVIADTQFREPLIRRLKDHTEWRVAYEDRQAVVFARKKAI
jgi:hypothetical protein